MFGWSKPTDPEFPTKVEPGYGKYMPNGNGDAKPKSLAFDARATVDTPFQIANTSEDEMAIATIVSRSTYLTRFGFNKTQSPNTLLLELPTCPSACLKANVTGPTAEGTVWYNTFLSYLSQMFIAYRGSLKYTFRVVKTPFHSGRIAIFYVPGALPGSYSTVDQSMVYRKIFDLRETSEIEFEVPFVYNTPFKTLRAEISTIAPTSMVYTIPTGMIFVSVVNSLRNPSTAADSIDIIVEVAGGEDFQFAGPMIHECNVDAQSRSIVRANEFAGPIAYGMAQSGIVPMSDTAFSMNKLGTGEVVQSLRTILKRYTRTNFMFSNPLTLLQATWQVKPPTPANLLNQRPDFYSWISQLFRYQVGGMRLAILQSPLEPTLLRFEINALGLGMFPSDALSSTGQRANAYQFPVMEPLVEIGLPFYQTTPAILSVAGDPSLCTADDAGGSLYERMPFNSGTELTLYNATTNETLAPEFINTNLALVRAAAEDFSFLYLIGPPITAIVAAPPP